MAAWQALNLPIEVRILVSELGVNAVGSTEVTFMLRGWDRWMLDAKGGW